MRALSLTRYDIGTVLANLYGLYGVLGVEGMAQTLVMECFFVRTNDVICLQVLRADKSGEIALGELEERHAV